MYHHTVITVTSLKLNSHVHHVCGTLILQFSIIPLDGSFTYCLLSILFVFQITWQLLFAQHSFCISNHLTVTVCSAFFLYFKSVIVCSAFFCNLAVSLQYSLATTHKPSKEAIHVTDYAKSALNLWLHPAR